MTRAKLLVEGNDDQHVIWSLLEYYKVPEVFAVEEKKGIDNLLDVLPVQLKESGIERVGVVVDADAKISTRWQKIKKILRESGFRSLPKLPDVEGTVIEENGKPRVGVWIMPDNTLPGMLENFAQFLIPKDDKLMRYVQDSLKAIAKKEQKFKDVHRPKAEIHTWLAWQEDPGTPMGLAITKKYLDAEASHAKSLIKWLERLFVN